MVADAGWQNSFFLIKTRRHPHYWCRGILNCLTGSHLMNKQPPKLGRPSGAKARFSWVF
jgi:hypothetical protein